jgi:hypothetical protein
MEPSRVELLSKLSINFSFVHRLSPVNPWDGDRRLSLATGFSNKVLATKRVRDRVVEHPLGLCLQSLTESNYKRSKPMRGCD